MNNHNKKCYYVYLNDILKYKGYDYNKAQNKYEECLFKSKLFGHLTSVMLVTEYE